MTSTIKDVAASSPTIYFGYGSNLWLHQMDLRCPTSKYLGVARLNGYKWIINGRGYANVVEVKSKADRHKHVVFGLVYSLKKKDEARLDVNEGVPDAYTKEYLACDFWASTDGGKVDVDQDQSVEKKMLVYIDRKRVEESTPKKEYIVRMNKGIVDAVKMGVPEEYVHSVMRRFIPEEGGNVDGDGKEGKEMEKKALRQAVAFVDEN
ncbi:hypothetical protein K504DRAFT_460329 [Pleomassaria siparia CBS 279.74]|uniref:gamma-glutamylcyclotransferase n=1 Tax=Pleomassaria siparia CBS 279.74 TaxID=1314801 RepID=A0A6G1JZM4_9PLEO|nr:hypothetical protein K504DRAFT_460329 [Pleomassaria siparia CBS 279.74]